MPIRQIGICSLIFLATILICAGLSFYNQQFNKTQLFFANWRSSHDQLQEGVRAHSATEFSPRQYIRIVPDTQENMETLDSNP